MVNDFARLYGLEINELYDELADAKSRVKQIQSVCDMRRKYGELSDAQIKRKEQRAAARAKAKSGTDNVQGGGDVPATAIETATITQDNQQAAQPVVTGAEVADGLAGGTSNDYTNDADCVQQLEPGV